MNRLSSKGVSDLVSSFETNTSLVSTFDHRFLVNRKVETSFAVIAPHQSTVSLQPVCVNGM